MEGFGGMGGGTRGGTISHVQDSTVGGRRGEAGHPIGKDRSGREQQRIDRRDILEEAAEVVAGTATSTMTKTAIEETTMTEGEWEDPPATQGLG